MSSKMKKLTKSPNDDLLEVKCYVKRSRDSTVGNLQQEGLEESGDIFIHDGVVYERITDNFKIDLDSIPDHVRDDLASATLDAVQELLSQPGGRELLDAKKDELKKIKERLAAKTTACANDN